MSIFKFKRFEVDQVGCAMKINTDGVLIGATAAHSLPKNILDIGTGTGVIALMLAQRFPNAFIEAVEIDEQAAITAKKNFFNSAFCHRLSANYIGIQDYSSSKLFDLIVSNPPFFVNNLKNQEIRKGIARHADKYFFELLIAKSIKLLAENGKIWLIVPVKEANGIIEIALSYELSLAERVHIHSDHTKPTFRQMICLTREKVIAIERDFYIYESFQKHTDAYKDLLKDFFLAF